MQFRALALEEWFDPFVKNQVHLWTPLPTAANLAMELLAEGIHKRPDAFHIFVMLRLMTVRWWKVLGIATDVLFHLPPKINKVWLPCQYEPLPVTIAFPSVNHVPGRWATSPRLRQMNYILCARMIPTG